MQLIAHRVQGAPHAGQLEPEHDVRAPDRVAALVERMP
jgi:hypothetical protein